MHRGASRVNGCRRNGPQRPRHFLTKNSNVFSMHMYFKEITLGGKGQPFKYQFPCTGGDRASWLPCNPLMWPDAKYLQDRQEAKAPR